jgi:site-specific DNA recombinase
VISWKAPHGYRRVARGPDRPAHLEIFEPEAAIVRRIFAERAAGTTIRQICRQLNADAVPTPTGSRSVWGTSTLGRILGNEAYIGRTYFNRTETVPDRRPGHHSRQVPRPRSEWIAIGCPAIVADQTFQAAAKASADNSKWSPRRAEPGAWLLRGLVKCGPCGVGANCHKMRGRNGTWHRYYYCRNHDSLRPGGQDRRCPERNIRADALDEFVFGQIRAALLDPALLLAGEQAIAVHAPAPDDQLLAAELARLDRKLDATRGEHNRLIDLYQAGLINMPELQRRAATIAARQRELEHKRASLAAERADLARGNRLRHGVQHSRRSRTRPPAPRTSRLCAGRPAPAEPAGQEAACASTSRSACGDGGSPRRCRRGSVTTMAAWHGRKASEPLGQTTMIVAIASSTRGSARARSRHAARDQPICRASPRSG